MANSSLLLDRLARLSHPYEERGARHATSELLTSVADIAIGYMQTLRHTTPVDDNYGAESASYLYKNMNSDRRFSYYKSLEQGMQENDARISKAYVQEKYYKHRQHGRIMYLDILLHIDSAVMVDSSSGDLTVRLAYDFTGSVFRVKQS